MYILNIIKYSSTRSIRFLLFLMSSNGSKSIMCKKYQNMYNKRVRSHEHFVTNIEIYF